MHGETKKVDPFDDSLPANDSAFRSPRRNSVEGKGRKNSIDESIDLSWLAFNWMAQNKVDSFTTRSASVKQSSRSLMKFSQIFKKIWE